MVSIDIVKSRPYYILQTSSYGLMKQAISEAIAGWQVDLTSRLVFRRKLIL